MIDKSQKTYGSISDFDLDNYNRLVSIERQLSHGTLEEAVIKWNLVSKSTAMPIITAVETYMEHKRHTGCTAEWLVTLKGYLKRFAEYDLKITTDHITPLYAESFIKDCPLQAVTKNNIIRALKTFGKWMLKNGMISQGLDSLEYIRVDPKPIEYISAEDTAVIFDALEEQEPRLCAYNALRAFSGMRTAHANRFQWSQVVMDDRALRTIQQGKALSLIHI